MRDTTVAASYYDIGDTHDGVITGIKDYGVFVQLGQASGLCHVRAYGKAIAHASLARGHQVTVRVLAVRDDGKLSLALLTVNGVKAAPDRVAAVTRTATNAVLNADAVQYASGIRGAFAAGIAAVNEVGSTYANNDARSRAGMVAEAAHAADFNVDAHIKRSPLRAERANLYGKASPDIRVRDGSGTVVQEVSSKVCADAKTTANGQRPYGEQTRLVPADQLEGVKKHARRNAASNRAKDSPQRAQVAKEHQQVTDRATGHVEQGGVRSKARTRKESQELGNKAKDGKVTGADLGPGTGRAALDGAKAGAKGGAIIGACTSAVGGAVKLYKSRGKGKEATIKVAREVVVDVAESTAEGAVKGAISGGATAAAQVVAQQVASATAKRVLNGSAPAALAITTFELAKHSVDLARGKSTVDEFKTAAGQTVLNNSVTFIGAEIGFMIGGPIGALVGGLAAPLLVAAGRSLFSGGQVKAELAALLDIPDPHDGAISYHRAQLRSMLDALAASEAVLFADRILPTDTAHMACAEAVLVHRGRIYVADFKAWKGALSHPEIEQTITVSKKFLFWTRNEQQTVGTGRYDMGTVIQGKTDQYGLLHTKRHRDPGKSLRTFVSALRRRLSADRRWKTVAVMSVAVFPDGDVTMSAQMRESGRYLYFSEFLALLAETEGKPTPRWMLDGLSTVPTWDMVQDATGRLHTGILVTSFCQLVMDESVLEIPFHTVLKLEKAQEPGAPRGAMLLTLHDGTVIQGVAVDIEVELVRKGHRQQFALHDLSMVCPAYQLFAPPCHDEQQDRAA